ncbi:hypothetical protein IG197_27710 [Aminobacter sp. SR38]|jgi:hypothetical protein|uniref:hypothetical protein n=1 Tax=Aminobacter sp. SR38 TaxID=2774562 RepID=UPI0017832D16|nr:hypothetical protein [Aminobacter sp. SR38]QOF71481.1 hypothetical protein IG197_27710 [Aminobacter sp. SR38]
MEYVLKFNEQQMQVLDAALREMPYRLAAPVFQTINEQIAEASRGRQEVGNDKEEE